jgi:hypothetical protein
MIPALILSASMQVYASPAAVAKDFLAAYLKQGNPIAALDGALSLRRFMTAHLVKILEDAIACQKDWDRQQPKGSTDKPPFVDCCVFASNPEGIPTAFSLGPITLEPDARYRVMVNYEYKDPPGTYSDPKIPLEKWSWRDALLVAKTRRGYRVDDFVFFGDRPDEQRAMSPTLLSATFSGCRGDHWVGEKSGAVR